MADSALHSQCLSSHFAYSRCLIFLTQVNDELGNKDHKIKKFSLTGGYQIGLIGVGKCFLDELEFMQDNERVI